MLSQRRHAGSARHHRSRRHGTMANMRFRTGLIVGLGVGYVLGAKAGRARYEQIVDLVGRVAENEQVNAVVEQAAHASEVPRVKTRHAMSSGLRTASNAIRNRSTPHRQR